MSRNSSQATRCSAVEQRAFAEYVCVREARAVALKPANITFEQAASVPYRGNHCITGSSRQGKGSARTEGLDQRRVWRRRHIRRADRESRSVQM